MKKLIKLYSRHEGCTYYIINISFINSGIGPLNLSAISNSNFATVKFEYSGPNGVPSIVPPCGNEKYHQNQNNFLSTQVRQDLKCGWVDSEFYVSLQNTSLY